MFKRFWNRLKYFAETLDGIDDPGGRYMTWLEQRVATLERKVETIQMKSRTAPDLSSHDASASRTCKRGSSGKWLAGGDGRA